MRGLGEKVSFIKNRVLLSQSHRSNLLNQDPQEERQVKQMTDLIRRRKRCSHAHTLPVAPSLRKNRAAGITEVRGDARTRPKGWETEATASSGAGRRRACEGCLPDAARRLRGRRQIRPPSAAAHSRLALLKQQLLLPQPPMPAPCPGSKAKQQRRRRLLLPLRLLCPQ